LSFLVHGLWFRQEGISRIGGRTALNDKRQTINDKLG
jgi:hypothetical protein